MIGGRFDDRWWKLPLPSDLAPGFGVISLDDVVHHVSRSLLISAVFGHQILNNGEQNDLAEVHHQGAEEGQIVIQLERQSDDARQEGAAGGMLP